MNTLREYRKELLLYCLQVESPASISELSEQMDHLSRQELHPRVCWEGINPSHIAGLIKELVIERKVMQSHVNHRMNGKTEPCWEPALKCNVRPMPSPPDDQDMPPTKSNHSDDKRDTQATMPESEEVVAYARLVARLRSLKRHLDELVEDYEQKCSAPPAGSKRRAP